MEHEAVVEAAVQVGLALSAREIPPEIVSRVPPAVAKYYRVVPLEARGKALVLAMAAPENLAVVDELRVHLGCPVVPVLADPEELVQAVDRYYGAGAQTVASVLADIGEGSIEVVKEPGEEEQANTGRIEDLANEAPIVKLVNSLIIEALRRGASDIFYTELRNSIKVRYRVDGILYEVSPPPKKLYLAIVSRIKIMADLNIAEKRLPQDGRIKLKLLGKDIDIRVSTVPTVFGESVALRLLDKNSILLGLADLGFLPETMKQVENLIEKKHGIVLVTGPTGSGKTTTLYAALNALNTPEKKIITIEDPVEYLLYGINQMQVRPKIDFGFANGLRSILRQDPDIIMVGEIRDRETAEMAIQAALTGHLVFSTLHTNDSASAVTRLLDMGVEPFLVASTVRGMMAQRLVRVLCPHCRQEYVPSEAELRKIGYELPEGEHLYRAVGCPKCNDIGYRGRTGIYELLIMTPELESMVLGRVSSAQIKDAAVAAGTASLRDDGWRKVRMGVTTVEEILRVTQE
ncbi:MAG: type II secretion system ATPase GspE [Firmicutes bacterium]|nr:type II secretion system ATPase GspE [Bacillota bacterium]